MVSPAILPNLNNRVSPLTGDKAEKIKIDLVRTALEQDAEAGNFIDAKFEGAAFSRCFSSKESGGFSARILPTSGDETEAIDISARWDHGFQAPWPPYGVDSTKRRKATDCLQTKFVISRGQEVLWKEDDTRFRTNVNPWWLDLKLPFENYK